MDVIFRIFPSDNPFLWRHISFNRKTFWRNFCWTYICFYVTFFTWMITANAEMYDSKKKWWKYTKYNMHLNWYWLLFFRQAFVCLLLLCLLPSWAPLHTCPASASLSLPWSNQLPSCVFTSFPSPAPPPLLSLVCIQVQLSCRSLITIGLKAQTR